MRASSWNCHHTFFCCSASSLNRRSSSPPPALKTGVNAQNVSSSPATISIVLENSPSEEKVGVEHGGVDDVKALIFPKSSLKKPGSSCPEQARKGNVKWMDFLGKELVEIKEFEIIEYEESYDDASGWALFTCSIQ